jgi:hypothetical protein
MSGEVAITALFGKRQKMTIALLSFSSCEARIVWMICSTNPTVLRAFHSRIVLDYFLHTEDPLLQAPVKRGWELMRVSKQVFEWDFLNSHAPVKQEQEFVWIDESWLDITAHKLS